MTPTFDQVGVYAETKGYNINTVTAWFASMQNQDWRMNGEAVRNWRAVLDGKMKFEESKKEKKVKDSAPKRLSYSLYDKNTKW